MDNAVVKAWGRDKSDVERVKGGNKRTFVIYNTFNNKHQFFKINVSLYGQSLQEN